VADTVTDTVGLAWTRRWHLVTRDYIFVLAVEQDTYIQCL